MRTAFVAVAFAALAGALPSAAQGVDWSAPGSLVGVSVAVEGSTAALYPARDGSGRYYLEAREGCSYEVALANRSGVRLGVVLSVDGLNAISGERDGTARPGGLGRMYVLGPWENTRVRGWRTSLEGIQRFTFVDERASYAARTGKANSKMGWIEVAVFREWQPYAKALTGPRSDPQRTTPAYPEAPSEAPRGARDEADADAGRQRAQAEQQAPPAGAAPAAGFSDGLEAKREANEPRSYPGTGWGRHEADRAVVVEFHPLPEPVERVTLRYEYRPALQALGLLPRYPLPGRDRLAERERGRDGFASPPPRD